MMLKQKTKSKTKREEPEIDEINGGAETPDVSELVVEIDAALEGSEELRDALSGCTEERLEAALKLRYDQALGEIDAVTGTDGEKKRKVSALVEQYRADKEAIYRAYNTTYEAVRERMGCACNCPSWI